MRYLCMYPLILLLLYGKSIAQNPAQIVVIYYSQTGNTTAMAEAVAGGARSVDGANVKLLTVQDAELEDIMSADALILGSPVYNANVAPSLQQFINTWPFEGDPLRDKIGAAFVTAGGISAGEELVQLSLLRSMLMFGMILIGGADWQSAFGASAIVEEEPFDVKPETGKIHPRFLKKARELGGRVADFAVRLKRCEQD